MPQCRKKYDTWALLLDALEGRIDLLEKASIEFLPPPMDDVNRLAALSDRLDALCIKLGYNGVTDSKPPPAA